MQQQDIYWTLVSNILFVRCCSQYDLKTDIALLTTRVKHPNMDNYNKLESCVMYIIDTMEMPLTLKAIKVRVIRWWINAEHRVHPDMKSHFGGMISLGKGAMHRMLSKQKLNTWSSTESKISAVGNHISGVLYSMQLLED